MLTQIIKPEPHSPSFTADSFDDIIDLSTRRYVKYCNPVPSYDPPTVLVSGCGPHLAELNMEPDGWTYYDLRPPIIQWWRDTVGTIGDEHCAGCAFLAAAMPGIAACRVCLLDTRCSARRVIYKVIA